MSTGKLVYVIMGNDFPEAVFTTPEAAEAFCAEKREREKVRRRDNRMATLIHWRAHPFELRES